jgi:hypothetical protein
MPGIDDPYLTRTQVVLIERAVIHLCLFGQINVCLMMELESEGINAQALIDDLTDQIELIHPIQ